MKNYICKNLRRVFTTMCLTIFLFSGLNAQSIDNANKVQNELSPKKEGVKRIGVLLPKVSLNNVSEDIDPAAAVRDTFIALLGSESFELIPLDARLNALAYREALEKECDFVLKISLKQIQKKKGGGFFNRILDNSADSAITETTTRIPTGGSAPGRVGRETVIGAGQEATKIEFTIGKKDKFVLDYELSKPDAKTLAENSLKTEAEKDNDDVLMPLIEKAANEIAEQLISRS